MGEKRRLWGTGGVKERADGRWEVRVELERGPDGQRRRKSVYAASEREALRELARLQAEIVAGRALPPARLTVGQYLEEWLTGQRGQLDGTSWESYGRYLRRHALPALGRIRLAKLAASDVRRLYADRLAAGLGGSTVLKLHRILHAALADAEREGLVGRNVAALVDPPRAGRYRPAPVTVEQARALVAAAVEVDDGPLWVLSLSTGLRPGEVLGLRWAGVDLDQRVVQVTGAVKPTPAGESERGRRWRLGDTKTHQSRVVPLSAAAVWALDRQRVRVEELRRQVGWEEHDLVFPSANGRPANREQLGRARWRGVLERACIPYRRWYDLRHSFATIQLALGTHPKIVSEMLGHSTTRLTLDTYSHVLPTMLGGAALAMDRALGEVGGQLGGQEPARDERGGP